MNSQLGSHPRLLSLSFRQREVLCQQSREGLVPLSQCVHIHTLDVPLSQCVTVICIFLGVRRSL